MSEEPAKPEETLDAKPCGSPSGSARRNIWARMSLILALGGLAGLVVIIGFADKLAYLVSYTAPILAGWFFLLLSLAGMIAGIVGFILSLRRRLGGRWIALAGGFLGAIPVLFATIFVVVPYIRNVASARRQPEDMAVDALYTAALIEQSLAEMTKTRPADQSSDVGLVDTSGMYPASGYEFRECVMIVGKLVGKEQGYARCATPRKYGGRSRRTFIVRFRDSVIWAKDLGQAQYIKDFPDDPAAEGWEKVCDKNGPVYPNGLPALPEGAKRAPPASKE